MSICNKLLRTVHVFLILAALFIGFSARAATSEEFCLAPKTFMNGTIYSQIGQFFTSLPNAASFGRETFKGVVDNESFVRFEKIQQRLYKPLNMTGIFPVAGILGIAAFHIIDSIANKNTQLSEEQNTHYKKRAEAILGDLFLLAREKEDSTVLRALTYIKNIEITTDSEKVGTHGKDIASGTLYLTPRSIDNGMARYLIFRRAMGLKFSNEVMIRQGTSNSISESFWSRYIAWHFSIRDNWWSVQEKLSAFPNGFVASFSRGKDKRILSSSTYSWGAYQDPVEFVTNRMIASVRKGGVNIRNVSYDEFFPWLPDPSDGRYYDEDRVAHELFENIRTAFIELIDQTSSSSDQVAVEQLLNRSRELSVKPHLLVAEHMGFLPSYDVSPLIKNPARVSA